ncbi:MAG: hypothetical protein ACXWPM_05765 [Bdellovibrionota bacterium]
MKRNKQYYSFRLELEKIKQKTRVLAVLAKLLVFLANVIACYLGRS